jgi:hypothetical protein
VPIVEIGSRIIKTPINFTFGGGFAFDADFGVVFSVSIEATKIIKNTQKSINFHFSPGGGSGPKHSAFCGACFSINPYKSLFDTKRTKIDRKNHEPSVFFMRHF